ncbi:MAG: hypothetical protein ACPGVO_03690 [Spirulinaceae cyanobacterium]
MQVKVLKGLQKKGRGKKRKTSPGQMTLPWDEREVVNPEVVAVAEKFVLANAYNPKAAGGMLRRECSTEFVEVVANELGIAVPGNETPDPAWVRGNQGVYET